jgi:hypothetical protein
MNESDRKFWPFKPRLSAIASLAVLIGLLLILVILRTKLGLPSEKSESAVLIGVLLFSVLPIVLALLDMIIERGGVIAYAGVKIDFSGVRQVGVSGITVPANVGVRGQPVTDSSTSQILDALREATKTDVVIIDLEEGRAWWETRLLVLLAGAERMKKPGKIIFVGTDGGKQQCFQGWGYADDLLRPLIEAHDQYRRSFQAARAAAKQWELVEPRDPKIPGAVQAQPAWMQPGLATQYPWMAFDAATGLPNELLPEQLLAADLGMKVELQNTPRTISLTRLDELFRPVLLKERVDESWSADLQITAFLDSEAPFLAVTQKGRYLTLVSKLTVLNTVTKAVVEKIQLK